MTRPDHLRLVSDENPWANPRSYRPDPAQLIRERSDLRLAQLRLRVHPPIDWVGIACVGVAVFCVVWFAGQFLRAVLS